ncbi:MAG: Rieske 2Fe-2S domain-containing protein [Microthrixaceae bacterium]|nr:Rieske 2Fe-2S domain-containing protein [Acidimicrobiales bacterium]MCB9404748.1 Rieske 2Fe-2S domain-containing protein [Microthrixaceae bacterium]
MTSTTDRYPFSMPSGWFAVAESPDVEVGQTKAIYYFASHMVLWRDEEGTAHVQDAYCPHLGAHLGHGGLVDGCNIVCPFHGWKFDGEGCNSEIPYSDRTNKKARVYTYPVLERNGFIYAWYHPARQAPTWEVEEIDDVANGNYYGPKRFTHVVEAAIQEMGENAVDSAHFRYVHNVAEVPEIIRYESDGHRSYMESNQKFPTPRGVVNGEINSTADGPGVSVVRFAGIVDTLLMTATTPVDAEHTQTRFNFYVRNLGDESVNSSVGEAFANEVIKQFTEDLPIWTHKAHIVRPALADSDGPFMKYRKWYSQFYADHPSAEEQAAEERTVYPAPYWPDRMDEVPGKGTASVKYGGSAL